MLGESPLSMMRPPDQRERKPAVAPSPRRLLWPILVSATLVIALGLAWVWGWYYAATTADSTLAAWVQREAAAGRVYACGSQTIGGFPFRIEARCDDAAAEIKSNRPQFAVKAKTVVFKAAVYHPTLLIGDVTGPLTLAESGQPPRFVADWSRAQVSVRGRPPDPEGVSFVLDWPRLGRVGAAGDSTGEMVFQAKHADLDGRVIKGSARDHPGIEATLHLAAARAPTLHPLVAEPIEAELDVVLRGFKDLSPKPWADRFREMQAAGGGIEIRSLRMARADAIIVGAGSLSVNAHGKLDGLIRVAVVGIEQLVPLLGVDKLIGRGLDRLTGSDGTPPQGLGALDRLIPGLGQTVRESANATLIENLKKMGQPSEIDKKPAIVLPLRFSDGSIYLGMLPLGEVPPLF